MDDMYQPAALFIGLRYMRGRAADRFGRFVSWLSTIGITLGVMALVTVLSVMNGFERELQNNILGLMPQAILSAKQGSVNPQQLPESEAKLQGVTRVAPITTGDVVLQRPQRGGRRDAHRPGAKRSPDSVPGERQTERSAGRQI
jgi:lipoprotein-releasing system permease protein